MYRPLRTFVSIALCCGFVPMHAKPIPDMKFRDLAGHTQRMSSLRGSITVVTFWATWCGPCREELPRLAHLKEQYAEGGVRFLAISIDESKDRARIEPYLQHENVALDVWVGADVDTLGRVGLGNIVPSTLILDKDGEVVGRIMGEARDSDVTGYLDWLLHDRQGTAPAPLIKRY